jgi:hypothetical protein
VEISLNVLSVDLPSRHRSGTGVANSGMGGANYGMDRANCGMGGASCGVCGANGGMDELTVEIVGLSEE